MINDIESNKGFYKDLDTNFEQALIMCEKNYTHSELVDLLKNGNIPQKQAAALKFDYIRSKTDADVLLDNLTGCDGKIREAVALAINRILNENQDSGIFFSAESAKIFAKATIDINANICRLVVDSAVMLKSCEEFSKIYTDKILLYAKESLSELEKFIFRDKKYVINKQIFKLYWCLEALKYFHEYTEGSELKHMLEQCSNQKEYTIREKTAQITVKDNRFAEISEKLKNDENYYVRHVFI